ncbi:helix-turn-helix domain-containing protein [Roseivirga sp.]|uniref:helix-turn-helix domain-containing protein n=1 Tax=Roseivirga sp. TaxID=1964215 RepID=UPI003B52244A
MEWNYFEVKPSEALSDFIDCYWNEDYCDSTPDQQEIHVVPDNTIELIITNKAFQRYSPALKTAWTVKSHLSGLKTRSQQCIVTQSPLICVRFKPKAFYLFSEVAPKLSIDNCLLPDQCLGEDFLQVEEGLFNASSYSERHIILNEFFEELYTRNAYRRDPLFEQLMNTIESHKGLISIEQLSNQFKTSPKTIRRRFIEHLGITPKRYCRLCRVIYSLKQVSGIQSKQLTQLALNAEYFDQSHFVKDVKSVINCTPSYFHRANKGIQSPTF